MKYNRDGTLYQLDTVLEAIESRCAKRDFPDLSDLLGSDWGFGCAETFAPENYKSLARLRAQAIYAKVCPVCEDSACEVKSIRCGT